MDNYEQHLRSRAGDPRGLPGDRRRRDRARHARAGHRGHEPRRRPRGRERRDRPGRRAGRGRRPGDGGGARRAAAGGRPRARRGGRRRRRGRGARGDHGGGERHRPMSPSSRRSCDERRADRSPSSRPQGRAPRPPRGHRHARTSSGAWPRATASRCPRSACSAPTAPSPGTTSCTSCESYDIAAGAIRTAQDYRDITYEYLAACAAEGAVYVELIASLDHGRHVGLDDAEHLAGIAQGIDDAYADHGIVGRIISSIVRNFGVADCEDVARRTVALAHPYVVGLQHGRRRGRLPRRRLRRAFAIAADAGLGCSVHAGEHAGPESIRAALALPGVVRISHGVRAIEDPSVGQRAGRAPDRAGGLPDVERRPRRLSRPTRTIRWARCGPPASR